MRRRLGAALGGVLLVVAPQTEDVAGGTRDGRFEPRLLGGDAELALGQRADAVALEDGLAVGQRLARQRQRVRAARDEVEHRLGKAAASLADGAPLAREVRGQRGEVESGLPDQRAHARL